MGKVETEIQKVISSIQTLTKKIDGIENRLAELQKKSDEHDKSIQKITTEMRSIKTEIAADLTEELTQRSRRANNLIISGISELTTGSIMEREEHDEEKFLEVVQELGLDWDRKLDVVRIGKVRHGRPRLLKVTVPDGGAKQEILRNAKKLRKSNSFRNVYINHDQTPMQQRESKILREELKVRRSRGEDVVIFKNQVKQRKDVQNFH